MLVQFMTVLAALAISLAFLVAFLVLDYLAHRSVTVARILDAPSHRRILDRE